MKLHLDFRYSIIVLVFCSASYLAASERTVERLREDVAELKAELAELEKKGEKVATIVTNIDLAESEIAETMDSLPELEEEIEEMEFLYHVYKSSYRVVTTVAPGEVLGTFQLLDGSTVTNAVYKGTVKGGIQVQSASGVVVIEAARLPPEMAVKFALPQGMSTPPSTSYAALKAAKPLSAKTEAEIQEDEERVKQAAKAAELAQKKAELEAKEAEAMAGQAAIAAEQEQNDKILAEISALKIQYNDVYNQRKKKRSEKAAQLREFRSAKIMKSQVQIDGVMEDFDRQIEKLEDQEDAIKKHIAQLRAQL